MRIPVSGAELWVEEEGRGPTVLVPTGGGIDFYRRTFSKALRQSLRLIYIDMRETGGSTGHIAGATFASLADDVEAVRLALGLGPVAVFGHSNHASIALEYGLRHAASAAAIVAAGGVPDFTRAFHLGMERWDREASPAQKARLAQLQAEFAVKGAGLEPDELCVRQYIAITPLAWHNFDFDPWPLWGGVPRGAGAYLPWIAEAGAQWNFIPRLPELRVPVLALCGRWDYLCPVDLWQEAIGAVPDGRLEIFEESGHNPQYEEPARFDRVLLDFLRSHSTT